MVTAEGEGFCMQWKHMMQFGPCLHHQHLQNIESIQLLLQPNGTSILHRYDLKPITDAQHFLNVLLVKWDLNSMTEAVTCSSDQNMAHAADKASDAGAAALPHLLKVYALQKQLQGVSANILW